MRWVGPDEELSLVAILPVVSRSSLNDMPVTTPPNHWLETGLKCSGFSFLFVPLPLKLFLSLSCLD